MGANRDNFLFSGRPPDSDEWNEFLIRFHHHYPRATSDVFCQLTDEDGLTTYEVIATEAARELPAAARVLEIGCGEGELLAQLHARRPDLLLFGIDLVENAVACAQALVPSASVVAGDASRTPWTDGAFDAVLSHMMLPYAYDAAAILQEVRRLLTREGRFTVAVPDSQAPSTFSSVLSAALVHVRSVHAGYGAGLKVDQRLADPSQVCELFAESGLRIERDEGLTVAAPGDASLLADYVRRTYPLGLLDDVMLADVVAAVVANAPSRLDIGLRVLRGSRL